METIKRALQPRVFTANFQNVLLKLQYEGASGGFGGTLPRLPWGRGNEHSSSRRVFRTRARPSWKIQTRRRCLLATLVQIWPSPRREVRNCSTSDAPRRGTVVLVSVVGPARGRGTIFELVSPWERGLGSFR